MKWQAKTALIALMILGAAFFWWTRAQESEPAYRGEPLSFWVMSEQNRFISHRYGLERDIGQPEAILAIGTNALPFLTRWMQLKERPWTRHLRGLVPNLARFDHMQELADASIIGFRVLGPRASPAIPELVRLTRGTNVYTAQRALFCISAIGPPGIPVVLDVLTNRTAYCPDNVFSLLGTTYWWGTNADLAIPTLIDCLSASDRNVAETAAILLGEIGRQPTVVVPALVRCAEGTKQGLRYCAIEALGHFEGAAREAMPVLEKALSDPEWNMRANATNSLRRIAPDLM